VRVRLRLKRLEELLAQSSLSQNHWAIKMGLASGHWSEIVNGKHPYPSPKTRTLMLETFGVPLDELFEIVSGASVDTDAGLHAALADRYLIDKELGQGGMGTVYLARDVKHGRLVALKVISPEAVSGIGTEQFLKEIRYTARLQHHNILPLFDSGEEAGIPFYVMPYVRAGSLRDRLVRFRSLPVSETVGVVRGIAAALQHAHDHHVLHCDVKPENILLSDSHAFVADFGISRAIHSEAFGWGKRDQLDSSAGTPAYVSPEQATGERDLDGRSDVYSLACMVFEMLGGDAPFTGTNTMEIVAKRFKESTPDVRQWAPHLSERLAAEISRAMQADPERRPSSVGEFADALAEAASERKPAVVEAAGIMWSRSWSIGRRLMGIGPHSKRGAFVQSVFQDVRHACRALLRQPAFAVIAILTMALGIGANTAIFSVINGVLLKPLPFSEPDRLMRVYATYQGGISNSMSAPNFVDIRNGTTLFEDVAAFSFGASYSLTGTGEPLRIRGSNVTAGLFRILRVTPQLGRTFTDEDDVAGASPVVILTDRLWRERFEADPGVLGATLSIDGVTHTVVGVLPTDFTFRSNAQLWLPYAWDPTDMPQRGSRFLQVVGRLSGEAAADAAVAELEAIFAPLVELYPEANTDRGVTAVPLRDWVVHSSRRTQLWILGGAVGLVLLIACVNVANLMLARAEARIREIAVRAALGAGRGRLFRHFVTESVIVSALGGLVGLLGAYWGVRALITVFGSFVPRSAEVSIDGAVLSFALAVSILTGLAVGLVPALLSDSGNMFENLKDGSRTASGGGSRMRRVLVVAEVALALMLVTSAGLLLKSLWRIQQVDLGIAGDELLTASFELVDASYPEDSDVEAFASVLLDEIRTLPGVAGVAAGNRVPFMPGNLNVTGVHPIGDPNVIASFVEIRYVTPGFFSVLGIPLLSGRDVSDRDGPDSPPVVIVNQTLALQLFQGDDPIGRTLELGWGVQPEIVGVAGDVKEFGPDKRTPPAMYWPLDFWGAARFLTLAVRTTGDPITLVPAIRQAVRRLDPDLPLFDVAPMSTLASRTFGDRKFVISLLGCFAALALVLGAVGIYGVMSYTVEQRTREVGVRLALGASRSAVLRLVISQGVKLALIGLGIGAIGAFVLRQIMENLLFEVSGSDPLTYIAVAALLAMVAAMACYLPARRAASVDPLKALRQE
jgi:predicted permease